MDERRLRLGIVFNFNPSWMGGIIYILNLIRTLDFLDDSAKPEIFLFYRSDLKRFVDQICYPYISKVEWVFPGVYTGYITSWVLGRNEFVRRIINSYDLDGIYPLHDFPVKSRSRTRIVCWYADLQHEYYPNFFTSRKLLERRMRIRFILKNSDYLVVSSNAVLNDFKRFYKLQDRIQTRIYHFVSVIDSLSGLDINELRDKYSLPERYFIVSNQFHKHKNHKVLLNALVRLSRKGKLVHLALTGRFPDSTHSSYMKELHSIIDNNDLHTQISLLGIIPRDEQLLIMKHSQAVLQPSLFEGWSTVIEDAISLQVPVVASSLPVNIEQLGSCGIYFNPDDDERLADILENFPERDMTVFLYEDYNKRVKKAAEVFIDIFRKQPNG